MRFEEFRTLDGDEVSQILHRELGAPCGVAIPFDGTRRWYLMNRRHDAPLYSQEYVNAVAQKIQEIIRMIFNDGIDAIYVPALGHSVATARGPEYARFQIDGLAQLVSSPDMRSFCREHDVDMSFYGGLDTLPAETRVVMDRVSQRDPSANHARRQLRWGIFAGQALSDLSRRTVRLAGELQRPPTGPELIQEYYGAPHVPLHIWIGMKRPAVFGVPFLVNSRTRLYFLQFPTPFLDEQLWRRILWDALFVRRRDLELERLLPDDLPHDRQVLGLGSLVGDQWTSAPLIEKNRPVRQE